jgi:hypothetical protein
VLVTTLRHSPGRGLVYGKGFEKTWLIHTVSMEWPLCGAHAVWTVARPIVLNPGVPPETGLAVEERGRIYFFFLERPLGVEIGKGLVGRRRVECLTCYG